MIKILKTFDVGNEKANLQQFGRMMFVYVGSPHKKPKVSREMGDGKGP